ncbi:DUF4055 domain-containing protein [Hyphomicrobium sp. DY-1]|uniref:DUF4055 domain-containing protein n=1 Tax=Hyphomicrobium sp. DY-1 TaxID=3075650 RepID=UPI0039C27E98
MAGDVSTKHPDWMDRADEWQLMRRATRGEKAIKEAGTNYLLMPSGFATKKDKGAELYKHYIGRAQFPDIVSPTIDGMVGVIHRNESQIDMPDAMEPLFESATADGMPLEALHKQITRELLETGRFALLADAPTGGERIPYLAGYTAESLINWSEAGDFFVLDECGLVRDGFAWNEQKKYRILELVNGKYQVTVWENGVAGAATNPTAVGSKPLTAIPFAVAGPRNVAIRPEGPPLLGVGRSSIAIYQLSADYRWQLYNTGQDTLFIINGDAPEVVGAGVVVELKGGTDNSPPDAKMVGPTGRGTADHRIAMQDERAAAIASGARLFDNQSKTAESGDALRLRFTAQTATLQTIAQASAALLEKGLRNIAVMMGLDPELVTVKAPKRLVDSALTPQDAVQLVTLWQDGAISYPTLYENLQRGEIASEERNADEERDLIDQEDIEHPPPTPEETGILPTNVLPAAA